MKWHQHTDRIFTIHDFCSPEECGNMIAVSVDTGYAPATVNTSVGTRVVPGVRNNTRVFHTSPELADMLWQKLKDHFPGHFPHIKPIGLNDLFRFYKYEPGEKFKKHRDGSYQRNDREASYFTFLLYLNEGYTGGETAFDNLIITPATGMALIFPHDLLHEGCEVLTGIKYVLRSDIMCTEVNAD